jgi:RimJ/RimL family protein N-acetyltransferase
MEDEMLQTTELKLETRRLILRKPEKADALGIQTLIANWEIAKWLGRLPWPYPPNGAAEWIERMHREVALGQGYVFGLSVKSRPFDGIIGVVGLHVREHGEWELGYWLGEPYWGLGYMSEAAPAVVAHAFQTVGINPLTAGHFVGNEGSARVLLRCGFEYTGEGRRRCEARGHEVDCLEMELTRAKWQAYTKVNTIAAE